MKSDKFLNKCLKDRKDENKKKRHPKLKAKKAKQNYCVSLFQKMQKKLWQTKQKNGSGNKKFWKMMKYFFPDRIISKKQTSLVKIRKLFQKIVM